jgi:hypothetical protein
MATMVQHQQAITRQRISTLDVLWAFYQSQPKKVKKAFRCMLESQDKAEQKNSTKPTKQWQIDIKEIKKLKVGWDGVEAPSINKKAIENVSDFVLTLEDDIANLIRLFPTYLGAVMLTFETENGRIKCEIGDRRMSYFVKRPNHQTEHFSFLDITAETLSELKANLKSIA